MARTFSIGLTIQVNLAAAMKAQLVLQQVFLLGHLAPGSGASVLPWLLV